MIVLNVGGGPSRILPEEYSGWEQVMLDIDLAVHPDICLDAKEIGTLEAGQFDAIYCSHNLEHFYRHDAEKVLRGFVHVLSEEGYAEILVPDVLQIGRASCRERVCTTV